MTHNNTKNKNEQQSTLCLRNEANFGESNLGQSVFVCCVVVGVGVGVSVILCCLFFTLFVLLLCVVVFCCVCCWWLLSWFVVRVDGVVVGLDHPLSLGVFPLKFGGNVHVPPVT